MHRVIFAAAIIVFIVIVFFLIYQQKGIEAAKKGTTTTGGSGQPDAPQTCVPAQSYSPHRAAAHSQQHSGTPRSGNI